VSESTTPTRDEAVPAGWRYSINYGPDGEQNFANVYAADGQFVGNLRTHHAVAICNAFALCRELASAPAPASGRVDAVGRDRLVERALKRCLPLIEGVSGSEDVSVPADDFAVILGLLKATLPNQASAVEAAYERAIQDAERSFRRNRDRSWVLTCLRERVAKELASLSPAATPVSEAGGELHHATGERITRKDLNNAYRMGREEGRLVAELLPALAKPASSPAGGDVHEAAIGLLSELDAYCVGSRAHDRRENEARRALKAALSQSTSAGKPDGPQA